MISTAHTTSETSVSIIREVSDLLRSRWQDGQDRDEVERGRDIDTEVTRRVDAGIVALDDHAELVRSIHSELFGYGALQALLDDTAIEEIWINSPESVFVARGGISQRVSVELTASEIRDLVERMLRLTGRRVDLTTPFVDASLPDGSRLHVAIPDVTRRHWSVNIRKFSRDIVALTDLVSRRSLTAQAAEFLRLCLLARCNIIVSGATQAGKTTLLNALLSCARESERIITVEETFELDIRSADSVALQCRQPNLEGTGEIGLRRLIKESLRMRPDRLVVGEVREAESLDLLIALNSGLPGACSIHANGAADALRKLCTLPLLAGRNIDASFVTPTVADCVDIVVHCELDRRGLRRVREIIAPTGTVSGGSVVADVIFHLVDDTLIWSGKTPCRREKFERARLDPALVLTETS